MKVTVIVRKAEQFLNTYVSSCISFEKSWFVQTHEGDQVSHTLSGFVGCQAPSQAVYGYICFETENKL